MANIILDQVQRLNTEVLTVEGKVFTDYGKILQRIFNKSSYRLINSIRSLTPVETDDVYLTEGLTYYFGVPVVQSATSPNFLGVFSSPGSYKEDSEIDKATVVFAYNRLTEGITFNKSTSVQKMALVDSFPKTYARSLIRLAGTGSSLVSITCGSHLRGTVAVSCQQARVKVVNCLFNGEGTAVQAGTGCLEMVYEGNVNHGDGRAVKITSSLCRATIKRNIIDIGSQLLWQEGDVAANSEISGNSLHNHKLGMSDEVNNGHFIYIKGRINGLTITDNSFNGVDRVNGDTSNSTQADTLTFDRPEFHIFLDGTGAGKGIFNLSVERNQFRFPNHQSINIAGSMSACNIRSNNFSGALPNSPFQCACLLRGAGSITNCNFTFNTLSSSSRGVGSSPTINMFEFSNKVMSGCTVAGNLMCTPGLVTSGYSVSNQSNGNTIRGNFEV